MERSRQGLWGNEGQATVEYVLLLLIVLGAVLLMMGALKGSFERGLSGVGGKLEKNLKTGRASVSTFRN